MKNQQIPADYSNNPGLKVSYKAPAQPDLDSIFLSLPDIVLITTPDLRIKTWNVRAEEFFGMKVAAVSGKIIQEAIRLTFVDANWELVMQELNLKAAWQGVILTEGPDLLPESLPHDFSSSHAYPDKTMSAFDLASAEKIHIQKVLNYTRGNKTEAARLLNIALTTLYRKLEEYKIG